MKTMKFLVFVAFLASLSVATISEAQYDQLNHIIRYAKASYCMDNQTFSTGSLALQCPENAFCVANPQIKVIGTVRPNITEGESSGTAFVAADDENETIYVAFRGSQTLLDWANDIKTKEVPYTPYIKCPGLHSGDLMRLHREGKSLDYLLHEKGKTDLCPGDCRVHEGLFVSFTQFMDEIHNYTQPYMVKKNPYKLIVTGHSLGGGYAGLAGMDFMLMGYNPLVVTFASLKQGNENYNIFVDETFKTVSKVPSMESGEIMEKATYARVYASLDIVPLLPPQVLPGGMPYTNGGLEFELTLSGKLNQTRYNVTFQGASDNAKYDTLCSVIKTIGEASIKQKKNPYDAVFDEHKDYFIVMGSPCSEYSDTDRLTSSISKALVSWKNKIGSGFEISKQRVKWYLRAYFGL